MPIEVKVLTSTDVNVGLAHLEDTYKIATSHFIQNPGANAQVDDEDVAEWLFLSDMRERLSLKNTVVMGKYLLSAGSSKSFGAKQSGELADLAA